MLTCTLPVTVTRSKGSGDGVRGGVDGCGIKGGWVLSPCAPSEMCLQTNSKCTVLSTSAANRPFGLNSYSFGAATF